MKYMVTEKQLLNLLKKSEMEVDEQNMAPENPAYPEVPKWGEHGQTPERGAANSLF